MADIPDFMRDFDTDIDYGFTPVSKKPAEETTSQPSADPLELAKIKSPSFAFFITFIISLNKVSSLKPEILVEIPLCEKISEIFPIA